MRNFYLLIFCLLIPLFNTAQEKHSISTIRENIEAVDEPLESAEAVEPSKSRSMFLKSDAETITLGSSTNIYSLILGGNNQVYYQPELNSLVFVHRENGNSGNIRYDISTDGGSSWENDLGPLTPEYDAGNVEIAGGCRYPNMTIWNPEGNTDPNNAFMVAHGPALSDVTGSWGNIFELSANLDGSNISENYTDVTETLESFHPYGLVATPDAVWSLSTTFNTSETDLERDTVNYASFYLNKGVYNDETMSFDWSVAEIFTDDWVRYDINENTFDDNLALNWSVGFSMDGQYGYAVVTGSTTSNPFNAPVPIVWKSSDFGETWEKLPYFEFADDEVFNEFLFFDEEVQTQIKPFFTGFDLVVDNDGKLHLFADVVSGAEEIGFSFTALESQGLFHCSTSDGTDWEVARIAPLINDNTGAVGEVNLSPRPQLSISSDGEALFFVWQEDDDQPGIQFPDVIAVGHFIQSDFYTPAKKLTEGTDYEEFAYWPTISPVSIVNGDCEDYEIPLVIGEPAGTELDLLQYYYVKCAGFSIEELEDNVGIENNTSPEISIYPNPVQDYLRIDGLEVGKYDVRLFDLGGRLILTRQINSSNPLVQLAELSEGSYILEVQTDSGVIAKRFIKE